MFKKILLILFLLAVSINCLADSVSVTMDHVDGLYRGDTVYADMPIKFHLRFDEFTEECVSGAEFGFVVYGQNSTGEYDTTINWTPVIFDTVNFPWGDIFELHYSISNLSVTGDYKDSVFVGGTGLLPCYYIDFQDIAFTIETEISSLFQGYSICIDSSAIIGGYDWSRWIAGDFHVPMWGGPYCFVIGPSCCRGYRGNVDLDPNDSNDIGDIVYLVNYMFAGGPEPPCFEEADIIPDGTLNISDLVFYVDHTFSSGPPPPNCP